MAQNDIKQIYNIFQIVEIKFMMEASEDALAASLDNMVETYNEFENDQVVQEIKRYRRQLY